MEWNKVKSMLIALLLVVNALLGLNIQSQIAAQQSAEADSLKNALELLQDAGVAFDEQAFFDMPRAPSVLSGTRSTERETQLADALLGQASLNEAGGGISIYTSSAGTVTFRNGGLFEAELTDGTTPSDLLERIVQAAEVKGMGYTVSESDDGVSAQLLFGQWTVAGSVLTCQATASGAVAAGRWYFGSEPTAEGSGVSRAEMVVALLRLGQERLQTITGLHLVYSQEQLRSGVRLSPVWCVQLPNGEIFLSVSTMQEISVE